jgi:hypothetical protein
MNAFEKWVVVTVATIGLAPAVVAGSGSETTLDAADAAMFRPFTTDDAAGATPAQDTTTRIPETTVSADKLDEEQLVGENRQPEWTTHRRFAQTRVYVLPPFAVEFEQWWRARNFRHDSTTHLFQSEIGIGLPYRFQLDYYENFQRVPHEETKHLGSQIEGRWAFAEWGEIWGNPTVYGEWKFNDEESDVYELKLLLGDEWESGWHWAMNGSFEQQVRDERETEVQISGALSRTLIDRSLSLGAEGVWRHETANGSRGMPEMSFLLGPSLQWRPTTRTHLDVVPLAGFGGESPQVEAYVIFGIDLGPETKSIREPASTRGS